MKKTIALVLALLLMSSACTAFAADELFVIAPNPMAKPNTLDIQIIAPEGQLVWTTAPIEAEDTVLNVVQRVLKEREISCTVEESPYGGNYITELKGWAEGAYGGYEGWLYYMDGVSPMVGIGSYVPQGGELVQVIYADFDLLVPVVEAEKDHKGVVTLTVSADVTTYDENGVATVTREPVAGATLTVNGKAYVTDEQGKARPEERGVVTLQVEKKDELGLPALLPFAPGYTLDLDAAPVVLPYSDLAEGEWYVEPVLQMHDLGVVNGFPGGTFLPHGSVTRAQAAAMLWRLQEQPVVNYLMQFADVDQEAWYAEAVRWCAAMGIVEGADGKFRPDEAVTRQDLAVMLMRYQQKVVKTALPADSAAPAFADNADIADYAAEAVYLLQKAGIVEGTEGKFLPTAPATRAALCKMLAGLIAAV